MVYPYDPIWIHAIDEESGVYSIIYDIYHEGIPIIEGEEHLGSDVEIILGSYGIEFGFVDIQWFATNNDGMSSDIHTRIFEVMPPLKRIFPKTKISIG